MSMDALKSAVAAWKKADDAARAGTSLPKWKNPYGKLIYDLNNWYGTAKEEALQEVKRQYEAQMSDLREKYAAAENDRPESKGRGRPKRGPITDEVKIAAYLARESGSSRTLVKNAINGAMSGEELDAILAEGKELNERNDW